MRALALTFDDGPDPVWTAKLLDLLAAADARASFFPITARAAAAPGLIARMRAEGHAVGLHCAEHVAHSERSPEWLAQETRGALLTLAELGVQPTLWRTPFGDIAPWTAAVAAEHGLELVGWDVDTHDWRGDGAAQMWAATRDALVPGAVVLCHDGFGPGSERADASQTLAYVELVLAHARRQGLALAPLEGREVRA